MGFLSIQELKNAGFKSVGENVLISDKASIYGADNISIGSNVRIDDFSILSAGVEGIIIGNYVHIAAYASLIGAENITLSDFSGISSRVSIYSSSDDYTGRSLTNPTVEQSYTRVNSRAVFLGKHVIVGAGSVVLPGVKLAEGCAVGALALVTKSFEEFNILAGNPAVIIKKRKKNLLDLEHKMLNENKQ